MGCLVTRGPSGNVTYSGTQYVNPLVGTHKVCIRTGAGINDIIKYGLTTNSSASAYCGMRMRVENGVAYIGRSESRSTTVPHAVESTVSTSISSTLTSTSNFNTTISSEETVSATGTGADTGSASTTVSTTKSAGLYSTRYTTSSGTSSYQSRIWESFRSVTTTSAGGIFNSYTTTRSFCISTSSWISSRSSFSNTYTSIYGVTGMTTVSESGSRTFESATTISSHVGATRLTYNASNATSGTRGSVTTTATAKWTLSRSTKSTAARVMSASKSVTTSTSSSTNTSSSYTTTVSAKSTISVSTVLVSNYNTTVSVSNTKSTTVASSSVGTTVVHNINL